MNQVNKLFVRHLVKTQMPEIVARSKLDCHVKGLHSIMLVDEPEHRLRLFYADNNHELHRNDFNGMMRGQMSLGFHPHHCDVQLLLLYGPVYNWEAETNIEGFPCKAFEYDSAITGTGSGFKSIGTQGLETISFNKLSDSESVSMLAGDIHTIYVPKGMSAAWFVIEGREDPNYEPVTYSTKNLETEKFVGLYRPADLSDVQSILWACDLTDD